MANTTKRRARRAAKKLKQQCRAAIARHPLRPQGGGGTFREPPPWPDEPEGGAGVREPRRPFPTMPTGAIALDYVQPQRLDLTAAGR